MNKKGPREITSSEMLKFLEVVGMIARFHLGYFHDLWITVFSKECFYFANLGHTGLK